MNTDIEQQLRESANPMAMNRPVDDILARGDRLRRRRSRGLAVGLGAAASVAVLGASLAMPPGSTPVVPAAVASWSGGETNLSAKELEAITDACLKGAPSPAYSVAPRSGSIPDDTLPTAAESRDGTVLAYFRHGDAQASCIGDMDADGTVGSAGLLVDENVTPLSAGTDLDPHIGFGFSDPDEMGGPVTDLWTVNRVSSRVDRVSVEIAGETFEGTVVDGVVLFWISESFSFEQVNDAVFTAYDSHGRVLTHVGRLTGAHDPKGPNDDSNR